MRIGQAIEKGLLPRLFKDDAHVLYPVTYITIRSAMLNILKGVYVKAKINPFAAGG